MFAHLDPDRILNTDPDPDPLTWLNPETIRIQNPGCNDIQKESDVKEKDS